MNMYETQVAGVTVEFGSFIQCLNAYNQSKCHKTLIKMYKFQANGSKSLISFINQ